VGLKRSLVVGLIGCTLAYSVMPLLDASLPMALTGLFFLFFVFEFSVVTGLSLATELSPDSRATMMSGYFAAAGAGRVVGALIGGPVWVAGGMLATASVSAAINGIALASLMWALKGWQPHQG
jgi:predicted MFS family arabinose efflux permease